VAPDRHDPVERPLRDHVAGRIHDDAELLVEEWIEWIRTHAALRPARMLPKRAIKDHLPVVVAGIGEALRSPEGLGELVPDALRVHARARREQGYDVLELLKEYHGLERIVADRAGRVVDGYPDADPRAVADVFLHLADLFSTVADVTVGVYRDTEEHERREIHDRLEAYARTLTHELKQPLQAIAAGAGMLELEESASSPERRARYLRMIRRGLDRITAMVDEIRDLVLFEGARDRTGWDLLESSVELVLREMHDQARRKGVRIVVEHPLPDIKVDASRVEIALVNLVSNGIKYADPEKEDRWVRVAVRPAGPREEGVWEIAVSDNGLGIPAESHAKVFRRHFRAHPEVELGTGIGLAITRQVVEGAGGHISFESEEGRGSTFRMVVPGTAATPAGAEPAGAG